MRSLLRNQVIVFLLTLTPGLLVWASLIGRLYPIHMEAQIPFFFDLLELHWSMSSLAIYLFSLINFCLIWLISKMILAKKDFWLVPLVFSLSPWFAYLTFAGSYYIYLLGLVLLTFYGLLLLKSGKQKLGALIFVLGSLLSLYSSLLLMIIYPLLIFGLVFTKFVSFKTIKLFVILILLFSLPLFAASIKNQIGFKNIFRNQITIFSDPGMINAVNGFQGEARKSGFGFFAKLTENKYIYLTKYVVLKVFKHAAPSTYFTPQESLLQFSFSPPIFFGFLIPFSYGFLLTITSGSYRKYFCLSLVLIIPSFFAKLLVDLNRLILFEPIIIFIINFGLINLIKHRSNLLRLILYLSIVLVLIQFAVTLFDINSREYARYERSTGGRLEKEIQ